MKDTTVESIANKLNVSKSTVSRVMRHCGGVDTDTRERILEEGRNIKPETKSECDIYVILPDVPQYFWRDMRRGMADNNFYQNMTVKFNIYTKVRDEATVLKYLDEADESNARAIIVATHITPMIHSKLEKLTEHRLVILLSEYYELNNAFYIGADSYQDGYAMGQEYISHYSDKRLVLFSVKNNVNTTNRLQGFCQAVKEHQPTLLENALQFEIDKNMTRDFKLAPSKLAPLFCEISKRTDSACIYIPTGLPQLPLAIAKAKLSNNYVCLCHDCYVDENMKHFTVICNQDVQTQGTKAIQAAITFVKDQIYPEKKQILIPSIIHILNKNR